MTHERKAINSIVKLLGNKLCVICKIFMKCTFSENSKFHGKIYLLLKTLSSNLTFFKDFN